MEKSVFDVLTRLGLNGNSADDHELKPELPVLPDKPRIGLALGGGAARGWAHIGIIKTLLAAGYKPDVIAGTSIGAVVGGCYAAGKLDELEQWALQLTKRRLFSMLDVSFGGAGLITGGRLRNLLERDIGPLCIDELPIRYAAIATEIGTGHEIWMTHGRLVEAMRASYALPGIFEPVRVGGRWLMDGALVNPVPVSAARALGARMVISVNLHADIYGRGAIVPRHGTDEQDEDLIDRWQKAQRRSTFEAARDRLRGQNKNLSAGAPPGIPSVMIEAFNITQDRIARARLAGDPPDIALGPRLGKVGLFEFHRAAETIALGRETAEKALEAIAEAHAALV